MKALALLVLLGFTAATMAQTSSAPAQDSPPKPRPPLKLNLDEVEPPRPTITFGKPDEKKNDPGANLPGLGGQPNAGWQAPSKSVFPQNTGGAEPPVK